ncbi:TRS31 [Enterospora canceri]|uniref:TRS31 n=1 Tax=Enterospora canceri TaxID=1081671 RepID=A0A1Y1S8F1_9MICR|nr:TRS31 [Enterospora canceri]
MPQTSTKILFAYLVKYLEFDENRLKELGADMGRNMLMIHGFEREQTLEGLLYKITYVHLPQFYETARHLEKVVKNKHYLITESNPIFTNQASTPQNETFCCETLIAGAIEKMIGVSGFSCDVTAHNSTNKVVYEVQASN